MHIETADVGDVDELVEQWVTLASEQQSYGSHVLPEDNRTAIRADLTRRAVAGGVLVAREATESDEEGAIAGFVTFGLEDGDFAVDAEKGLVSNLYVRPEYRGEGIGTALLSAAEDRLADRRVDRVVLEAMADNEAARRFYRRAGYDPHRVRFERRLDE